MVEYGLEWHTLDSYFQFKELVSAPATPEANQIRQYAFDAGGISTMCWKNDAGNVTCLPTGGGTIPVGTGAVGQVAFWTGVNSIGGDTRLFWDNTNKQLMVGISSASHFGTDAGVVVDEDASNSIIGSIAHSATVTHSGSLNLGRSRGTHASQTIVADADRISRIVSQGYDGAAYRDAASIDVSVDGTPGSSDMPGKLIINTTPDGSATLMHAVGIDSRGFVSIGRTAYVPVLRLEVRGAGATNAIAVERSDGIANVSGFRVTGSATALNDFMALFGGGGSHTGLTADRAVTALLGFYGAETWGSGAKGAYATLETTAIGSTARGIRFLAGPSGQWGIGGTTLGTTSFGGSGDLFSSGGAAAAPTWVTRATLNAALDHGLLTGLADDDHTQYALLAGRSGGQTLKGGTASGDDLTLMSTNNATKGHIIIGGSSWDETAQVIGLGSLDPNAITTVPGYFVHGNSSVVLQMRAYGTAATPVMLAQAARGTIASPTATQGGDNFFAFNCYGQINTTPSNFGLSAQLVAQATENFSSTTQGSKWTFQTTLTGTTTLANALTIGNEGSLTLHKAGSFIDLTAITAGLPNFKLTATSDTPTATWGAVTETIKVSTAPAGWMEALVGGATRYFPFWA